MARYWLAAAVSLLCTQLCGAVIAGCLKRAGGFDYTVNFNDYTTLQYNIVQIEGANYLEARQTFKGEGWTAWGLSPNGKMIGANAIIGLPGEPVQSYDLLSKKKPYDTGIVPSAVQDVLKGSVTQANGRTVLQFTRPLSSPNGDISLTEPIHFISAYSFAAPLAYHDGRKALETVLDPCETAVADAVAAPAEPDAAADDSSGTVPPVDAAGNGDAATASDCGSDDPAFAKAVDLNSKLKLYWNIVTDNGEKYMQARLKLQGEGWLGWGASLAGSMVGSTAVIGLPGQGVQNYDLNAEKLSGVEPSAVQDLVNATITSANGVTTLDFSRLLDTPSSGIVLNETAEQQHIFAYRSDVNELSEHSNYGSKAVNLGGCVPARTTSTSGARKLSAPEAHGLCMALAFAVLFPLGMLLARFGRRLSGWFWGHIAFQFLGLILALVGFALAVNLDSVAGSHFDGSHGRLGLTLIIAVIAQVLLAAVRPHAPAAKTVTAAAANGTPTAATTGTNSTDSASLASSTAATQPPPPQQQQQFAKPAPVRQAWQLQHRLFAALLLIGGYVAINLGLDQPSAQLDITWQQKTLTAVAIITVAVWLLLEVARHLRPTAFTARPKSKHSSTKNSKGSNGSSSAVAGASTAEQRKQAAAKQKRLAQQAALVSQPLDFA